MFTRSGTVGRTYALLAKPNACDRGLQNPCGKCSNLSRQADHFDKTVEEKWIF